MSSTPGPSEAVCPDASRVTTAVREAVQHRRPGFRPGEPLPSVPALMRLFDASLWEVVHTLRRLIDEGELIGRRGGAVVVHPGTDVPGCPLAALPPTPRRHPARTRIGQNALMLTALLEPALGERPRRALADALTVHGLHGTAQQEGEERLLPTVHTFAPHRAQPRVTVVSALLAAADPVAAATLLADHVTCVAPGCRIVQLQVHGAYRTLPWPAAPDR